MIENAVCSNRYSTVFVVGNIEKGSLPPLCPSKPVSKEMRQSTRVALLTMGRAVPCSTQPAVLDGNAQGVVA